MKLSAFQVRKSIDSERGAFLVLAALVLSVLFAFIAIAIDSARTLTTMSEKLAAADSIALATLDAYLNKEPTVAMSPQGRHGFKWGEAQKQVITFYNNNQSTFTNSQTITATDINASASGVEVKPGRWWVEKPAGCAISGCPCSISGPLYRPCFQECDVATGCVNPDGSTTGDIFATAMEVKLTTEGQGGVATVFARFVGVDKMDVEGRAYSASAGSVSFALPQIGVLLFDLSRAMTMDNYLPFERDPQNPIFPAVTWARRMEYTFPVTGGACSATGTPCAAAYTVADVASLAAAPSYFPASAYRDEYTSAAYASDYTKYACYTGTLNGATERHIVATQAGSMAPQPYTSMLQAVNTFLTQFKALGRAGDKILLLGFDNADIPEWHFPPQNAGNPVFLDPNDPILDQLILMTSSPAEAAKRLFIPRADSRLDLTKALQVAGEQILKAYPSTKIDPYIALFSNGFSWCGARNPAAPSTFTAYCGRLTPPTTMASTTAQKLVTGDNLRKHITSLDEAVVDMGESYLKPNGIRVHVVTGNTSSLMPIGSSVTQTHTTMIGHWFSTPSVDRCADDLELRKWRYINVIPYPDDPPIPAPQPFTNRLIADFSNVGRAPASPLTTIYTTNAPLMPALPLINRFIRNVQISKYLNSLSATTLGTYVPLRRECLVTTRAMADAICILPGRRLAGTPPTMADRITAVRSRTYKPPLPGTEEIDAEGRLLCEPKNGTASQPAALLNQFSSDALQSRSIVLVMPD